MFYQSCSYSVKSAFSQSVFTVVVLQSVKYVIAKYLVLKVFYFKSLIAHYLTLTSLLCYTTTKNCQPLNDQILIFSYVNPRSRKAVA